MSAGQEVPLSDELDDGEGHVGDVAQVDQRNLLVPPENGDQHIKIRLR